MEFRATVILGGKTATGIQVPDELVEKLGSGRRPPVVVRIGDYTYRTTVAPMAGAFWVPLAAEHREAAGVAAEQEVDVDIELDTAPREVALPDDLAAAMDNVVVRVEETSPGRPLLGLYQGVPLTSRGSGYTGMVLPDRITIYRQAILERCRTEAEVVRQVRVTVVHEVAHHFGIGDRRLAELGWA